MKLGGYRHYRYNFVRKRRRDTFILLMPIILTFVGILWFYSDPSDRSKFTHSLVSYIDTFLALLTKAV